MSTKKVLASKEKICVTYDYAPHYRYPIFREMRKHFDVRFYFGDTIPGRIKKIDYALLPGVEKELKNITWGSRMVWQKGLVALAFAPYDKYIVFSPLTNVSFWIFLIFSTLLRKKVFLWGHGWYGRENLVKKIIKRYLSKICYHQFVYGEYAKNIMVGNGLSGSHITVIYNSLDYDAQKKERQRISGIDPYFEHFGNKNPTAVFVGRLTEQKHLDQMIEAASLLRSQDYHINMCIIGDGSMRHSLEKKAEDLNLRQDIWFRGEVYDEKDVAPLLHYAKVCVAPGNVGLTAMHSMVYGTPVISHSDRKKQMPEFEAMEKTGIDWSFEQGNVPKLAERMRYFTSLDREEEERIRKKCGEVIDLFYNPQYQMREILNVLCDSKRE